MRNRILSTCGILAPSVYVGTVVLGGLLRPDYSHVSQPISDLIATGAPDKALLDPLFALYNLLTMAFAAGLLRGVCRRNEHRGKIAGILGAISLLSLGAFGFATLLFPEPSGGISAAGTTAGKLHIVFAGLSSISTMIAILFMGFWFMTQQGLHGYASYSFVSVAIVFLSGGCAAFSVAAHSPVAGAIERITIGGFMLWLLAVALAFHGQKEPDKVF
jgi:Protein of unknown function (DUF998)